MQSAHTQNTHCFVSEKLHNMLLIYIHEYRHNVYTCDFIYKYAMCCNQDYEVKSQSFEMENQC